jgi:uncharacterized protein
MTSFNFDGAKAYALHSLEKLAPHFIYHNIAHTRDDVVPAVERLAQLAGIQGDDLFLLLTGAYFHDIGHIYEDIRRPHEEISIGIARDVLLDFGYNAMQIDVVSGIIRATQMPQTPHTILEQIMADADLDSLGREDFLEVAGRLRQEMALAGTHKSDEEWYQFELDFLSQHTYFTQAARNLRDEGKRKNLEALQKMLAFNPL